MVNYDPSDQAGWEPIWRSGNIPSRFQATAAPATQVIDWADTLPPGAVVLDVGCGVGRHTVYLGGRGFRMAGLDISPSGVEMTRQACVERQIPFDGKISDISAIPWPDTTFDGALSTSTIHHHPRAGVAQAVAEVWRILKPGGLFLVDFSSTNAGDYPVLKSDVAEGKIVEIEPNTFVDQRPESQDRDGHLPHHYSDEADVRDLLRQFEILRLWEAPNSPIKPQTNPPIAKWVASARKPASA